MNAKMKPASTIFLLLCVELATTSCGSRHTATSPVAAAIKYHNRAAEILNRHHEAIGIVDDGEMQSILRYYELALASAKQAHIDDMDRAYPGFGTHFRDEFEHGLELYVDNYNAADEAGRQKFMQAQVLIDQWGDWYSDNYDRIQAAR